jgi:hypothetical protein
VLSGLLISVSPGHTVLVLQVSSRILYLDFTGAIVKFTVLFYVTLYSWVAAYEHFVVLKMYGAGFSETLVSVY